MIVFISSRNPYRLTSINVGLENELMRLPAVAAPAEEGHVYIRQYQGDFHIDKTEYRTYVRYVVIVAARKFFFLVLSRRRRQSVRVGTVSWWWKRAGRGAYAVYNAKMQNGFLKCF